MSTEAVVPEGTMLDVGDVISVLQVELNQKNAQLQVANARILQLTRERDEARAQLQNRAQRRQSANTAKKKPAKRVRKVSKR